MALYEHQLQQDLSHLKGRVREMGDRVEQLLKNAIHALLSGDDKLANATVLADHPINRLMRELDGLSHDFIARHLPSDGHLRLISSIIRINIALERVGDYAVTISRESLILAKPGLSSQEVETVAGEALSMFHDALTAFYTQHADAARATMKRSAQLETTLDSIYRHLMEGHYTSNSREIFALFAALSQLKRVADQAKNICEDTLFAISGETKAQKRYNILFVDEDNACISQMAEAIAGHNHPHSGHYRSGGSNPAPAADAGMIRFMGRKGVDLAQVTPKPLNLSRQALSQLHVIVSLQGDARKYVPEIPFHTAFIDWDLGKPPQGEGDRKEARYGEIYRELAIHIAELMELLRGEGAD